MSAPPSNPVSRTYLPQEIWHEIATNLVATHREAPREERGGLSKYAGILSLQSVIERTNFERLSLQTRSDLTTFIKDVLYKDRVTYVHTLTYQPNYKAPNNANHWYQDVHRLIDILPHTSAQGFNLILKLSHFCGRIIPQQGILVLEKLQFLPFPIFARMLSVPLEHLELDCRWDGRVCDSGLFGTTHLTPAALARHFAQLPHITSATIYFDWWEFQVSALGPPIRKWSQTLTSIQLRGKFDPDILWSDKEKSDWPVLEMFRLTHDAPQKAGKVYTSEFLRDIEKLQPLFTAFAKALRNMPRLVVASIDSFFVTDESRAWSITYVPREQDAQHTLFSQTLPWKPNDDLLGLLRLLQPEQCLEVVQGSLLTEPFSSGFASAEKLRREIRLGQETEDVGERSIYVN